VTPEAFVGGPIALIKNGDAIQIDGENKIISLKVSNAEMASRRKNWKEPKPRYSKGVLAKYAKQVSSASSGAVTE
jgi:dihydroxy-acid dehydratase